MHTATRETAARAAITTDGCTIGFFRPHCNSQNVFASWYAIVAHLGLEEILNINPRRTLRWRHSNLPVHIGPRKFASHNESISSEPLTLHIVVFYEFHPSIHPSRGPRVFWKCRLALICRRSFSLAFSYPSLWVFRLSYTHILHNHMHAQTNRSVRTARCDGSMY